MHKIRMLLVGLLIATGVALPLVAAVTVSQDTRPSVTRIATEPTPTPTPRGDNPCPGNGC